MIGPLAPGTLTEVVKAILEASGAAPEDAALVAAHVVDAEIRENRSQGLMRVATYSRWVRQGVIAARTEIRIEKETTSTLLVDGQQGWGHVVALQVMDLCIERARQTGVCFAVVKETNHVGRLGYYVEAAAEKGMIGLIAGSGNPKSAWVAPWGGTEPIFGTNPLAIGFPRPGADPVVVDISTTQTARGNVLLHQKTNTPLPDGLAFDATGQPTRDPHRALPPHGTLAPLGGHKGYALALAVEILCGVLGGPWPPPNSSNLIAAIDPSALSSGDDYQPGLERLIAAIKGGARREGVSEILIPGEGSQRRRRQNADGVLVTPEVWGEVTGLARSLGVNHALVE